MGGAPVEPAVLLLNLTGQEIAYVINMEKENLLSMVIMNAAQHYKSGYKAVMDSAILYLKVF